MTDPDRPVLPLPPSGPGPDHSTGWSGSDRLAIVEAELLDLRSLVESLAGDRTTLDEPGSARVTPRVFPTVALWVTYEFAPGFTRGRQGGRWRWCARWFDHPEAVSRLTALWQAWEALHDGGDTSAGTWYRDHLDHQLPILMGADGPFRSCGEQHWPTDPDDTLVCADPPAGHQVRQTPAASTGSTAG